ncbi:hypothetical protein SDC9_23502 [bioreactor metagenome]|uniref:DUF4406 domain-containing protein n=1 Tax=bioreactor metagenome TaxID=1076179 RepID=A0A644UF93_9ZZZZ
MNADHLMLRLRQIRKGSLPAESILEVVDPLLELLDLVTTDNVSIPAAGENSVFIAGDLFSADRKLLMQRNSDAEILLKAYGHKPLNPLSLIPEGSGWQPAMRISLTALIKNCTSIALFPEWGRSRDAQTQFLVASHLGYNVIML